MTSNAAPSVKTSAHKIEECSSTGRDFLAILGAAIPELIGIRPEINQNHQSLCI
jgi:hypothetical protein